MEHYIICILNNPLSEKDHSLINQYITALFPSASQYHYVKKAAGSVAVLLQPIYKHVAVLNACEENENIAWKLLNEDHDILNIIENEITRTDSALEFDSLDTVDYMCESLHSLVDQLPACGTYKLDVLLGSDVLRELSLCKEPALVGVFIRLTRWHSAHFTIFEQKEFDLDRINEWCELTNAQLLFSDNKFEFGPHLWRGSLQLQINDKKEICKGFQLQLELNSDVNNDSTFSNFKEIPHQYSEHIVMSSKLQILSEVTFDVIPLYLINPILFKLYLSKPSEVSLDLVEYLLNNEKVALVATLGYSELKERSKPERKYSSKAWEKAASLGDIRDSECFVSSFEKFITFVITKSSHSDYVVAYPLSCNINASFYFTLLNNRICNALSTASKERSSAEETTNKNILYKYLKSILDLKNDYTNSEESVNFLIENNRGSSSCTQFDKKHSSKFLFEEIDPSDWPERIQLLHKQMKHAEEKDGLFTNVSIMHNLKLPHQSYSLSSQNVIEHFLSTGEGKKSENLENINLNSNSKYVAITNLSDVLEMKWPEIMNLTYHDLYYNNSNQAEDKENIGSQLVNLYVQNETACICNKQQLNQHFQITIPERVQSPSKAFRGPGCRLATASIENREISPSPRKNNLKELITKKILSTSTLQVKNSEETKKPTKETRKRNASNKSFAPVRCSPRKKNPVNYNYTVNRNNENKNAESSKMPDLLRKKLRCAVAKALEDNGISATHKLYQPCGAKLLTICRTFLDDLKLKKGKTSEYLQKIADAHVKQVIEFSKDS